MAEDDASAGPAVHFANHAGRVHHEVVRQRQHRVRLAGSHELVSTLTFDANYEFGLTNVFKDDDDVKQNAARATVGLKF